MCVCVASLLFLGVGVCVCLLAKRKVGPQTFHEDSEEVSKLQSQNGDLHPGWLSKQNPKRLSREEITQTDTDAFQSELPEACLPALDAKA